jgi:hypothetical protein
MIILEKVKRTGSGLNILEKPDISDRAKMVYRSSQDGRELNSSQ